MPRDRPLQPAAGPQYHWEEPSGERGGGWSGISLAAIFCSAQHYSYKSEGHGLEAKSYRDCSEMWCDPIVKVQVVGIVNLRINRKNKTATT